MRIFKFGKRTLGVSPLRALLLGSSLAVVLILGYLGMELRYMKLSGTSQKQPMTDRGWTDAAPVFESLESRLLLSSSFYLSPGRVGGDGSWESPFGTLESARDAIRAIQSSTGLPEGGITVYLRGGTYTLSSTFQLTAQDSGTATSPIRYAAYPGESVQLIGGSLLDSGAFALVDASNPLWNQVAPAARGHLQVMNLASAGITDYGQLLKRGGWGWNNIAPMELFYNGQAMTLGRTEGWLTVSDTPDGRYSGSFTYTGSELAQWAQAGDVWFSGLFGTYWYNSMVSGSINAATSTITLAECPQYGIKPGMPFYAFNLLSEVDTPGEYYLDRSTGDLYFWAPEGLNENSQIYVSQMSSALLRMTNTQYITIEGLTLEASRGGLVEISGGAHNRLVDCTLRNSGTYGATISGTNNGLDHSRVYSVGERGVLLSGGDRVTLTAAGNYVTNTDLYEWGRWIGTSKVGIHVEGVGQIIANNEMHDAPSGAIWYYGNNHRIEYNDIYNVCHSTADAGAIYAGRDWSFRGTVIQYNFIHDMSSPFTTWELFGVYLDDAVSGSTIHGNIFYRINGFAMFNGGGRDNIWTNNVVSESYGGFRTDRRGVDIITNTPGHDCNFLQKLNQAAGGNFKTNSAWMQAYPELANIPSDYSLWGDIKNPGGTVFSRNIGYHLFSSSKWLSEGTWGGTGALSWHAEVSNNLYGQNPLFADAAGGDFNLLANSPALAIPGFEAIPFDQIGIRERQKNPLAGDYTRDGVVDLADYTVWADLFGQTGENLPADGNGDGSVGLPDYTIWADNYMKS